MDSTYNTRHRQQGTWYWGNSLEGAIFSTATVQNPINSSKMGTLRFSYFINAGATYNYDITSDIGFFTGVSIKNVGFIEKMGDSTVKHRTYNLCIPIALKFGNLRGRRYFFAGMDIEMPFNYKEKGFIKRSEKQKFNSWFSARTPAFMPTIFAGFSVKPGITFKLEYYLNNFMNPQFTDKGIQPYAGYDVHLILLSIGTDIHFGKRHLHRLKDKLQSHHND